MTEPQDTSVSITLSRRNGWAFSSC